MPPLTACPGAAPLRQLLQGQATAADADRLEQHVVDCPRCLQQFANLASERELVAAAPGQVMATRPVHQIPGRLREKMAALKPAFMPGLGTVTADDVVREMMARRAAEEAAAKTTRE